MENIVVEGARGLGKSSITRYLRDKTTNSTLINYTGFNEKGEHGKAKVSNYYKNWKDFFWQSQGWGFTFIHDRYFFSEFVYSKLYKDYDFESEYLKLVKAIPQTYDKLDLFVLWTDSVEELERNLNRDKVQLFGEVSESTKESLKQQISYLNMAIELKSRNIPNLKVHIINVARKSVEQIGDEILRLTNTN